MNKNLIEQIREISRRYGEVQSVLLFGSRAHGDHTPLSDIDLAIKAPQLTEKQWLQLTFALEEKLDTLLKIDVVQYDTASEPLRKEIDRCHQVLYSAKGEC